MAGQVTRHTRTIAGKAQRPALLQRWNDDANEGQISAWGLHSIGGGDGVLLAILRIATDLPLRGEETTMGCSAILNAIGFLKTCDNDSNITI